MYNIAILLYWLLIRIAALCGHRKARLMVSLDTVRSNALLFGKTYNEELHRVIIHGILHLCGINDKGPGEREIMEAAENKALAMQAQR